MRRFLFLLLFLLPFVHAEICVEAPVVNVTPNYTIGVAGSIQSFTLSIQNVKTLFFCPRDMTLTVQNTSITTYFDPVSYGYNVSVPPLNESRSVTLKFSSLANTTPGNYTITFKVTGYSYEGTPNVTAVTAIMNLTRPSLNQPDLFISSVGFHCFDKTRIPRSTCYLYDSFSLDNFTVNNSGTKDYDWNVEFEATNVGPNLSATFGGGNFSRIPKNSSVVVDLGGLARSTFALAVPHTVTIKLFPKGAVPELSEANNEYTFTVGVSSGYPPGCFYNNPPCGLGYTCRDNDCIPLASPTLLPIESPTPTPAESTPSPTPLPTLNATEADDLRNQAIQSGQDPSEIDRLLNESFAFQREGKYSEALAKFEEAKKKVKENLEKIKQTNSTAYLMYSLVFLFILLVFIVILVIRKRKREEAAKGPPLSPSSLQPPSTVSFPEVRPSDTISSSDSPPPEPPASP